MVKLSEIYDRTKSPLDNSEILQRIVEGYAKSSRTDVFNRSDLYSFLVKMNQNKDNTGINLTDKEQFFVDTYNQWIDNILRLNDNQMKVLEQQRGMAARELQQYLKSFGKVSSMQDITRLKSNPLFEEDINGWELNDGWEHIKSQYISGRQESKIPVKHRLYIGCQNQDMWKLAQLFKSKCESQQIPFYFKLGSSSERDDKMVVYADTDNLANYISAFQEIAQEHPEIVERCGEPPALTGTIDNWIGIGDEPPLKSNGENQSYNSLRADIFEAAIEETLLSSIKDFKGQNVTFDGKQVKFNDLFIEQAAGTIIEILDKNKDSKFKELPNLGLKDADLTNPKFKEHIKNHLRKNITTGLKKLDAVKDIKETLGASNYEAIFSIPTRDNKNIGVSTCDMDKIIKGMLPIMQQVDPQFMDKVKTQISARCKAAGISDNFCFQQESKERFEQVDARTIQTQSKQKNQEKQSQPSQTTTSQTNKEENAINKQTKTIRTVDIVNLIKPELLQQKIELPNGAKIPARQYIQEVVAPHIPSNGRFVLQNKAEISAKQYIEEYILGEGQQKYKGDISKLLSENTRANAGTITLKGKQVNAIDIVDSLNPALVQKEVSLPNGVQISAKQYIQEVVAPHIPSSGKFILKSNDREISATQFIEEAVMFAGQENYNGDINALLDALTVANGGTVEVKEPKKTLRGQALKQEMGISPAQAQKMQEEQEFSEHEEHEEHKEHDKKQKEEQQKLEESNSPKLPISKVDRTVTRGKVTTSEVNHSQKAMAEIREMSQLMFLGSRATEEQKRRLEQLRGIYQVNQNQQNQQRQSNGMGR